MNFFKSNSFKFISLIIIYETIKNIYFKNFIKKNNNKNKYKNISTQTENIEKTDSFCQTQNELISYNEDFEKIITNPKSYKWYII